MNTDQNRFKDRLRELYRDIKSLIDKLSKVPGNHLERAREITELCRETLKTVPSTDTPVYIHVTGTDKSFKTSFLLDLFDNDELRKIFAVKMRNTSENTAVPCLVEPSDQVEGINISQICISTGGVIRKDLNQNQFNRLYDLSSGAQPDDYLLSIEVPSDTTPMTIPVIEYPGIKEGADAMDGQKRLHQTFQDNMLDTLVKFPGILVACFQHKIAIPPGHPLDAILKKYGTILKTGHSRHKLPLVISMQGESALTSYCGNTNVEHDIANDFKSFTDFDTLVQLVNPCNLDYPVTFGEPGPHVDAWIRNLSRYQNLDEIKQQIMIDGGIAWSRRTLKDLCTSSTIQDAIDNLFLSPWISEASAVHARALDCLYDIENHDEVEEVKQRMRRAILNESYQGLRGFFTSEFAYAHDGIIPNHEDFWTTIFTGYLEQFFRDSDRSKTIAKAMWNNLRQRLDPENKGFLGTREADLPHIIMNMAELYVPNALLRGDYTLMERSMDEEDMDKGKREEDTTHAV